MEPIKFPRAGTPAERDGWTICPGFLQTVAARSDEDHPICMEQVEEVLLTLEAMSTHPKADWRNEC